jgi:hypothetical protein
MASMPRIKFPPGSLLAAMLGEQAPVDARRAARRLRSEGAPAVAVDEDIAGLARGLADSEVSRAPAVLDALPPLFWLEAPRQEPAGALAGWAVEKKPAGLAARGFRIAAGRDAVPEPQGTTAVAFGTAAAEDAETRLLRGLVAAIGLPEMLAQMGESSPILLLPAEAGAEEASLLRGFRLSVATTPEAAPQ